MAQLSLNNVSPHCRRLGKAALHDGKRHVTNCVNVCEEPETPPVVSI